MFLMPDRAATAGIATPPGDCDETLFRAIAAGRLSASPADDPRLAGALAAYQKIESLFAILGSGMFGTVYLAHDPDLGRPVAIKAPRAAAFASPGDAERFLAEARLACCSARSSINSPPRRRICGRHPAPPPSGLVPVGR